MRSGKCSICGQNITDASGCWQVSFIDYGINHMPRMMFQCCSWCKEGIDEALEELAERRSEERKSWE